MKQLLLVFLLVGVGWCNYEICSVDQMGGTGDGKTDNTDLLRKLFSECDEVIVPSGEKYVTHPLNITRDNFVLTLEGTLLYYDVTNLTDWPVMPHLPSYPNDRDVHNCCRYQPPLLVYKATNVTIRGGGELNGQGKAWWAARQDGTLLYGRPQLLQTMYASKVQIMDITLKDSPFWTTHLWSSEGISIDGVKVRAPTTSPNTDGFDPDSSHFVTIKNSSVRNGDDCIAIKSGMDEAGVEYNRSAAHIFIDNVDCETSGVSIGSETSGGVEDVLVTNCRTAYLQIKTAPSRGGHIKDIRFLKNDLILGPLIVDTNYEGSDPPPPSGPPTIDNILYEGNTGTGALAGKLICSDVIPCTNFIAIDNQFDTTDGYYCVNVTTAYASNNSPKWCHHRF